ncbi:HD domain-containing protein [Nocardia sp. NPDC051321]|uniref:HD domain-containing protein n=1 Tax=Nocardia sp. NPDC051321 TaxID=3364323 RepID=UPI0037A59617
MRSNGIGLNGHTRSVSGILGRDGWYRDPMWAVGFRLTPVERQLLRTWELRRLQFITHAGAAAVTTHQTYSRLEHSLGLLSLVAHFAPDDEVARVAALLHDIGHLPFSHTFEGVAGLRHHELGRQRVRSLAPLLAEHGIAVDAVLRMEEPNTVSVLRGLPGGLKLDHLESFVRSGRAHARLSEPPPDTLAKLRLVDGAVHTDRATADYLAELALGEALYLCSWENALANGALRGLVGVLLDHAPERAADIASMTDDELWAALLADPRTTEPTRRLRRDPLSWQLRADGHPDASLGWSYQLDRLYLDTACVEGDPVGFRAEQLTELPQLPWRCVVIPPGGQA